MIISVLMNNRVYQYAALIDGTSAAGNTQTARIVLGVALTEEAGGRVTASTGWWRSIGRPRR